MNSPIRRLYVLVTAMYWRLFLCTFFWILNPEVELEAAEIRCKRALGFDNSLFKILFCKC